MKTLRFDVHLTSALVEQNSVFHIQSKFQIGPMLTLCSVQNSSSRLSDLVVRWGGGAVRSGGAKRRRRLNADEMLGIELHPIF